MSRYEYDVRRPTRRHDDTGISSVAAALTCVLLFGVVAAVVAFLVRNVNESATRQPRQTHDSMTVTHTYNGESIRYYVMTDPDTDVQYIVNDRGGMCVREFPDED